eukprot:CAMPEP_0171609728 /NCGR_PEP_ID=MMETSP0990-20121206/9646_1 /TAXON_ID=483369 /ORGANISM="non described non described, Strain CCMP2098" /LENGTH=251 /DNA_ID=CAMNT_0012173041 /DNA_START=212 /DNA_END=967 /DNA_ORIENTATION=-
MMLEIRGAHTIGNTIRMVKLPLILLDSLCYAGAIGQFYWLTKVLEERLAQVDEKDPMIVSVRALRLSLTGGYETDLAQLYGEKDWKLAAERARTPATDKYCRELENATPTQLVAASFILYGALIIGGGKATQKKVRNVFPGYTHALYDVSDDMLSARKAFRECFNDIGKAHPGKCQELVAEAGRFMRLNNTVVVSVSVVPTWWWRVATVLAITAAATAAVRVAKPASSLSVANGTGLGLGLGLGLGMYMRR